MLSPAMPFCSELEPERADVMDGRREWDEWLAEVPVELVFGRSGCADAMVESRSQSD